MKNNKKIAIIVIVNIIIIGIICSFINIKANVVREKQVIKEMSESAQVSNLQTQINTLNKEHTDYANYIQANKRKIANAITEMGVETSENADADTMASNIKNIVETLNQNTGLKVYAHVKNLYNMSSQTMTFTIPKDCNINIFGVFNCNANSSYSSNAILVYLNNTRILANTSNGINRGYIVYGNNISVKANDVIKVTFNTDYTHYNSFIIYESPSNIINILDNASLTNNISYTAPSNGYYIVTNGGASGGNYPGDYIPLVFVNNQYVMQGAYNVAGCGNLVDYIYVKKGDVIRYTSTSSNCNIHRTILNFIPNK